jgi:hypothetical protein
MANHLFDTQFDVEAFFHYGEAVNRLGILSSKNYDASRALQGIIEKACGVDNDKYGYMLKTSENVIALFDALKRNSSKENRQYFNKFIHGPCRYPRSREYAERALDLLGSEESIFPDRIEY